MFATMDSASRNHCLWLHSTVAEVPPATERIVQVDDRKQLNALSLCERVFGRKEQLFSFQDFEVARASSRVAQEGQIDSLFQRLHRLRLSGTLIDKNSY